MRRILAERLPKSPSRITDKDRADSQLGKRLRASKPAELIETKAREAVLPGEFRRQSLELTIRIGVGSVVAVVVNRVKHARQVFETLLKKVAHPFPEAESQEDPGSSPEVALLIGRTRDHDREEITIGLLPFARLDLVENSRTAPLIIVATQCIGAGADLDFDAFITEIAPSIAFDNASDDSTGWGATLTREPQSLRLRTRSGKVPRPIRYTAMQHDPPGIFCWRTAKCTDRGNAARHIIDFGIERSATGSPRRSADGVPCSAKERAGFAAKRDQVLERTSPRPAIDPEVSLYLHGPE